MPSNDDLKKQILEIDKDAEVEDLNNAQLAAKLSELKKDPQAGAQDAADKKAEAQKAKATDAAKKPPYYIAEGKALTSKRGILGPGDEVKVDYLPGGKDTFDKFVKSGHIKKA